MAPGDESFRCNRCDRAFFRPPSWESRLDEMCPSCGAPFGYVSAVAADVPGSDESV